MVHRCCVPFCTSKVGDFHDGRKIKFHRLPQMSNAERLYQWTLQITNNKQFSPVLSNTSRVCSKHFRQEDYLMKKPFDIPKLRESAQPTLFQWNCGYEEAVLRTGNTNMEQDEQSSESQVWRTEEEVLTDDKSISEEISRKNSVIKQLLGRISFLEEEQKRTEDKISELRSANSHYENQIREMSRWNHVLQQRKHNRALVKDKLKQQQSQENNREDGTLANDDPHSMTIEPSQVSSWRGK